MLERLLGPALVLLAVHSTSSFAAHADSRDETPHEALRKLQGFLTPILEPFPREMISLQNLDDGCLCFCTQNSAYFNASRAVCDDLEVRRKAGRKIFGRRDRTFGRQSVGFYACWIQSGGFELTRGDSIAVKRIFLSKLAEAVEKRSAKLLEKMTSLDKSNVVAAAERLVDKFKDHCATLSGQEGFAALSQSLSEASPSNGIKKICDKLHLLGQLEDNFTALLPTQFAKMRESVKKMNAQGERSDDVALTAAAEAAIVAVSETTSDLEQALTKVSEI